MSIIGVESNFRTASITVRRDDGTIFEVEVRVLSDTRISVEATDEKQMALALHLEDDGATAVLEWD